MARASINIKAGFDLDAFSKSSQNLARSMRKTGKKMQQIGKSMSTYLTAPIVAMGVLSLKAYDEQAKALAQVEAGLVSTGNQVGKTTKELEKMAEAMQMNSLFGDEEILKNATAQLLTFTNIAGEQFDKTQQIALDLATRLDGDLKSASIMLGKALNDPVANLSALSRAGIQFSNEQKETVKRLVETNKLAEAQNLILKELETQYGGSAEAAARAGLGPMKQLQMAIGDLSEEFGKIIAKYLIPFVDTIKGIVQSLKELSPETKKIIVVVAGLVAAIGPLILAVGGLTAAFAFLAANPIVLIITGIIVALAALAAAFIYVRNNTQQFADLFYNIWVNIANQFITVIQKMVTPWSKFLGLFDINIGNDFIDYLDGLRLKGVEAEKDFDTLEETVEKVKQNLSGGLGLDKTVDEVNNLSDGVKDLEKFTEKAIGGVKMKALPLNLTPKLPEVGVLKFVDQATLMAQQAAANIKQEFQSIGEDIADALNNGLQNLAATGAALMGEFIGSLMSGGDVTIEDFGKGLLNSIGQFMSDFGKSMIAIGVAQAAIKASIETLNPALAIAGGIALVAAGTALSNISKAGIGGNASSSPVGSVGVGGNVIQPQEIILTSEINLSGRDMRIVQKRENSFTR